MSFFDTIKKKSGVLADAAGGVAKNVVKQSKTLAAIGRVKLSIASEEDKIKKAYLELGRLFYRDYEAQTEAIMKDYQPWCDKVSDAKMQIARLNEELEKLHTEEQQSEQPVATESGIELDLTTAKEDAETPEPDVEVPVQSEESQGVESQNPKQECTIDTLYVDVTDTE